jgi:hypothetical protein
VDVSGAPGSRLENAVLVDKNERGQDRFEGHDAPSLGERIVPGPKPAEAAIDATRQVEDRRAGARWIVRELVTNHPDRRDRAYVLRQLTSTDDPELIGLRDEYGHTKTGLVDRPVESREKPV